jgi:hypothetical protein
VQLTLAGACGKLRHLLEVPDDPPR